MIYYLLILFFLLILLNKNKKSGYKNYIDYEKISEKTILNCPEQFEIGIGEFKKNKSVQLFGYTKNELLDITRFKDATVQELDFNNLKFGRPIEKYEPLPTDPDFFKHL